MSAHQNFSNIQLDIHSQTPVRPRFSMTSDILSFRLCRRQYGYFGNDGFVATQTTQLFYGTIIHQVLDRAHRHFSGMEADIPPSTLPTDDDIERYYQDVENALTAHGIRPKSGASRNQALRVIKLFNRVEGPTLYPRVFDTEFRLESDRNSYILRGVVDVLADGPYGQPGEREIWDYKGKRRPDNSSKELQDYIWQMCVYAELYRSKTGVYPARAILYFMNELDIDPAPTNRPIRALYEVNFQQDPELIPNALRQFDQTASEIIEHKNNQSWPAPQTQNLPPEETCDVCDIRWNCSAVGNRYPRRYPI